MGAGSIKADFLHGLVETLTVFGFVDSVLGCADKLNIILIKNAVLMQGQRAVKCCLATHGGQNGIGALFFDDFFYRFPSDGFDVGSIGHGGVGHDGGWIGVHQNDAVAFFTKCFTGLCA